MKLYLDLCCLSVDFLRGPAHDLENDQNPISRRAAHVRRWLEGWPSVQIGREILVKRTAELVRLGLRAFGAFHVACAEEAGANVLVSCDDGLLAAGGRLRGQIRVRIIDPMVALREILS